MDVGIAGVGKMGAAIALRLMEAGHKVTVWNRSADKTKPLADAGAGVAAAPARSWPPNMKRSSPSPSRRDRRRL